MITDTYIIGQPIPNMVHTPVVHCIFLCEQ